MLELGVQWWPGHTRFLPYVAFSLMDKDKQSLSSQKKGVQGTIKQRYSRRGNGGYMANRFREAP